MKEKSKNIIIVLLLLIICVSSIFLYVEHNIDTKIIDITTGSVINDTNTGAVIEINGKTTTGDISPQNIRDLLDYQIEKGEGGKDYIVITPTPEQPKINGKTADENNEKMRNYIWSNRITFNIDTEREGYIMFITEKAIKKNTNIFFGLDGKTIGRLNKNGYSRIQTKDEREFLYPIDSLELVGNDNYRFKAEIYGKDKISINAVVGEDNNKIEKIIIFFR